MSSEESPARHFRREGGRVLFDLSEEDYAVMMIMLGYAIGARSNHGPPPPAWITVINAINKGNPDWRPYQERVTQTAEAHSTRSPQGTTR